MYKKLFEDFKDKARLRYDPRQFSVTQVSVANPMVYEGLLLPRVFFSLLALFGMEYRTRSVLGTGFEWRKFRQSI